MTVSQHIKFVTDTFLATPHDLRIGYMLALLGLLFGFIFLQHLSKHEILKSQTGFLLKDDSPPSICDPLKIAFADGILNSKLY